MLSPLGKPCRQKDGDGNSAIGQPPQSRSTEQRLLENHLKFTHQTGLREKALQMLDGLQQRILLGTLWRLLAATQARAQHIQPPPQPPQQVINRFQRQGQAHRLDGGFNRDSAQQFYQELPQQHGRARMARKNFGQENRKGLAAAAALPTIRTKDPLPPPSLLAMLIQILPVKKTMAVQRIRTAAAGAALLLEGKSSLSSCLISRTKRNLDCVMSAVGCLRQQLQSRIFSRRGTAA